MGRPHGCSAAAIGAYLYAFGGEEDDVVQPGCMTMYNMATRKMEEGAKPPSASQFCTGVACCGLVYSLGGWDNELETQVADMCIYNPDMDSWVGGPALPLALSNIAAAEYMGCIYACGGWSVGEARYPSGSLLMLDPCTRSWASLPAMPTPVKKKKKSDAARAWIKEAGRMNHLKHSVP